MKHVGLVIPSGRGDALGYAREACAFLRAAGVEVYTEDWSQEQIGSCHRLADARVLDVLVTLGGDGTLLRGAGYASEWNAPLLGVNLGRMGFLAETEPRLLKNALQALMDGAYEVEQRPMLDVSVPNVGKWKAMNDAVLTRGGYARLITVHAMVDNEEAACYHADGLIVATPTGSTGYSLSAGGPIISPKVDCMVITPVCAHSLQHRPAVVQGSAKIRLELGVDDEMTAALQVDGQNRCMLHGGENVFVSRSERMVRLVRLRDTCFFQLVRHKLVEWSS